MALSLTRTEFVLAPSQRDLTVLVSRWRWRSARVRAFPPSRGVGARGRDGATLGAKTGFDGNDQAEQVRRRRADILDTRIDGEACCEGLIGGGEGKGEAACEARCAQESGGGRARDEGEEGGAGGGGRVEGGGEGREGGGEAIPGEGGGGGGRGG